MDAEAYNSRGLSYLAAGDEDAAYAEFTECIRLMKDNPAPFYNRALVEMARENWHEALTDLDRALLLDPHEPDALTHRASTRSRLGDFAGALEDCNRLVERYPEDSRAYLNRAIIRFNHADLAAALDDCMSALAQDPQNATALDLRARIQGRMGSASETLENYDLAISLNPDDPETWKNRAFARGRQGDVSGALRDFREAMRLESFDGADSSDFRPGQCWQYDAPQGEEASRIHVLMTEQMGKVPVVHVAVSNLAHAGIIEHLPVSAKALRDSVLRLDMTCPVPQGLDLSGIVMWRRAVRDDGAGAWANPLKEVVAMTLAFMDIREEEPEQSKAASTWQG